LVRIMSRVFHFIAGLSRRSSASGVDGVELQAMERRCLEQARLCRLPESKAALEEIARNYREAINRFALSTMSPG
jgi:hypothetical protein